MRGTLKCKRISEVPATRSTDDGFSSSSDATATGVLASTNKAKRSSKFAGVYFDRKKGNWRIDINIPVATKCEENFVDETEAAKYYDELVKISPCYSLGEVELKSFCSLYSSSLSLLSPSFSYGVSNFAF